MIDNLLSLIKTPLPVLMKARADLTHRYRTHGDKRMRNLEEKESYLLTRFPATYAVAKTVLSNLEGSFDSLLDLGAGPASASLAAFELDLVKTIDCVEQDKQLSVWGQKLLPQASFTVADMTQVKITPHDLILFSYSIGELKDPIEMALKAWEQTQKYLIIIEPGTPHAYQELMKIRSALIEKGAYLQSPCPHENKCPLQGQDWCHFAQRINRHKVHKLLKEATLGYEDEKYSYLIFSKIMPMRKSVIIEEPKRHGGHYSLMLCTAEGIKEEVITRSDDQYKILKKAQWGTRI